MRCPQCGCIFCDDLADERAKPRRFCGRRCKNNASADRLRPGQRLCNRKMLRFTTQSEALLELGAINQSRAADPGWKPLRGTYQCENGGYWHLTSKPEAR